MPGGTGTGSRSGPGGGRSGGSGGGLSGQRGLSRSGGHAVANSITTRVFSVGTTAVRLAERSPRRVSINVKLLSTETTNLFVSAFPAVSTLYGVPLEPGESMAEGQNGQPFIGELWAISTGTVSVYVTETFQ